MRSLRLCAAASIALGAVALGAGGAHATRPATSLVRPSLSLTHHLQLARGHHSKPAPTSTDQQSLNWSGYVTGLTPGFTSVAGTWTVPTVTPTADDRYSSDWVGIGGDPSPDLVQAGTEQDSVSRSGQYYAWIEVLPAPELEINNFAVRPGDSMTVTVVASPPEIFTLTVTNNTTGQTFSQTLPYSSSTLNAEWIHEAVTVNGQISALPKTSNAHFDHSTANGQTISANSPQRIVMDDQNTGAQIATPSALDSDGDGFVVADGASTPSAPSS